jgi:hypothetical protein
MGLWWDTLRYGNPPAIVRRFHELEPSICFGDFRLLRWITGGYVLKYFSLFFWLSYTILRFHGLLMGVITTLRRTWQGYEWDLICNPINGDTFQSLRLILAVARWLHLLKRSIDRFEFKDYQNVDIHFQSTSPYIISWSTYTCAHPPNQEEAGQPHISKTWGISQKHWENTYIAWKSKVL